MESPQAEVGNVTSWVWRYAIRLGIGRAYAISQRFSNASRAAYCPSLVGQFKDHPEREWI